MTKGSKKSRKAAQEAARKRNLTLTGIIVLAIVATVWIATSAKENTVVTPYPTAAAQEENAPPPAAPPADTGNAAEEESAAPANEKHYTSPPPMTIDTNATYLATVKMANGGEFVIELYPDKAPVTVNSFVFLAREGFFDGTTFHRVLDGFMAQGGDPTGTGRGGPGYQFINEDSDLTFDKAGVVAMANAGRDTNGSQFFITFVPVPQLNGDYTIFGQVIEGMDVVNHLTRRDPMQYPDYSGDVIESITIEEK
jgi:cyclophilin family peptidyl-prolyl cis-trans isomerase